MSEPGLVARPRAFAGGVLVLASIAAVAHPSTADADFVGPDEGRPEFTTFSSHYHGPLGPGASVTLTANGGVATAADGQWTPPSAGTYPVTAVVDDVARIAESEEENNAAGYTLSVSSAYSPYAVTQGLYVDPDNPGMNWYNSHRADPRAETIRSRIAGQSTARWVGPGDISGWVGNYVNAATAAGKLPQLVAYAIPDRDCGGHSGGGEPNTASYLAWAQRFAQAVGDRPAVLFLEPDSTMLCWNQDKVTQLRGAIDRFNQYAPRTWVYLDAGDGRWNPPSTIAPRIQQVGLKGVRGVSLNISNYNTEATIRAFMSDFNSRIGRSVPFVFDVSRNGNGPDAAGNWCNPAGRKIGAPATAGGGNGLDATLWMKFPGVSDGNCGAYPDVPSGVFDPRIAMNLINGT